MSLKIIYVCLTIIACVQLCVSAPNITYDQRQAGHYNIHIDIKDVAIISFDGDALSDGLGEDSNYDYDYDYGQLTINPLDGLFGSNPTHRPSHKPTTATVSGDGSSTAAPSTTSTTKPSQFKPPQTVNIPDKPPKSNFTASSSTSTTVKPTQSVVIIQESTSVPSSSPVVAASASSSASVPNEMPLEQIPVHVIMEPVLRPKIRSNHRTQNYHPNVRRVRKPVVEILGSERVNDVPLKENQQIDGVRVGKKCTEGKLVDRFGRCRSRRSGM